jgi:hypothetical protein
VDVSVDPRVELISIIFRLAGHPEYSQAKVPGYAKDVDEHFAPVKDHPVVQTARRLRAQYGVSYDAPMSLAVHLKDAVSLAPAVPLAPRPEGLDRRWKSWELAVFLDQARDFAAAGRFQEFFDRHKDLYDQAVARIQPVLAEAHLEWFDEFFGTASSCEFHLVLGMLNGPNCYGARLWGQDRRELYCILGVWSVDRRGVPVFGAGVIPTVVHEFDHSYVNPVVDKWRPQLRKSGQAIYKTQQQRMERLAYGTWQTMINESLVRASVIRYTRRFKGRGSAMQATWGEGALGFVWMADLVELLGEYEHNRREYPTFDAFMPQVVEFFDRYAATLSHPTSSSQPASAPTSR